MLSSHSTGAQMLFSVRAWRGLRYNEKYAAKLELKLAKKKERDARAALETTNPFSVG